MSELVLAGTEDWEGLYVDGELQYQNHRGRAWPNTVMDILTNYDIEEAHHIRADMATDEEGRLKAAQYPKSLEKLYESDDYIVEGDDL